MSKKMSKKDRRESILEIALTLSEKHHYTTVTRNDISDKGGFAPSLIQYHFGTMNQLRRDIIRLAIKNENLVVIAQGLACKDKHALKAHPELKEKAVKHLYN